MNIKKVRWPVYGLALVLAACGGGGGGGGPDGSVSAKNQALRELALVNAVVAAVTLSRPDAAKSSAETTEFEPKALTGPCVSGSSQTEQTTRARPFVYYSQTLSMTSTRTRDTQCRRERPANNGTDREITDGVVEFGETAIAADGYRYGYTSAGENGVPFVRDYQRLDPQGNAVPNTATSVEALGVSEYRYRSGQDDFRARFSYVSVDSRTRRELHIGNAQAPFMLARASGMTMQGEYRYSGGNCSGGTIAVQTPSPLTTASNGSFTGGILQLSGRDGQVRFQFDASGGATLQFQDGRTASASAAEIRAAQTSGTGC